MSVSAEPRLTARLHSFKAIHESAACLNSALQFKGKHASIAAHLSLSDLMLRVAGKTRIIDLLDLGMGLQVLCKLLGVAGMSFHAQVQRL